MDKAKLDRLKAQAERFSGRSSEVSTFAAGVLDLIAAYEGKQHQDNTAKVNRRAAQLGIASEGAKAAEYVRRFEVARRALQDSGRKVRQCAPGSKLFDVNGRTCNVWEIIELGEGIGNERKT